jgi:hypothetical protein
MRDVCQLHEMHIEPIKDQFLVYASQHASGVVPHGVGPSSNGL